MGVARIELATPAMSTQCSTTELHAHSGGHLGGCHSRRNPHLIRIETRAGHASGKPTDKQIAEFTDMYAFIAHFTGLQVPAAAAVRRAN